MIIWLASYPRSGNTFCRVLLFHAFGKRTYSIYGDLGDIGRNAETAVVVGHEELPEDFDLEAARASEEKYLIKTHEHPDETDPRDMVIYLVRDGRDAVISYYNYINDFTDDNVSIEDVLVGNCKFGSWGKHLEEWSVLKDKMLILSFEEMRTDTGHAIDRIGEFIDEHVLSYEIPDFSSLNRVDSSFFRKGKVREWENVLTAREIKAFEIINRKAMKGFGYKPRFNLGLGKPLDLLELSVRVSLMQRLEREFGVKAETLEDAVAGVRKSLSSAYEEVRHLSDVVKSHQEKLQEERVKNRETREALESSAAKAWDEVARLRGLVEQSHERLAKERESNAELQKELSEVADTVSDLQHIVHKLEFDNSIFLEKIEEAKVKIDDHVAMKSELIGLYKELVSVHIWQNPVAKLRSYKKLLTFIAPRAK